MKSTKTAHPAVSVRMGAKLSSPLVALKQMLQSDDPCSLSGPGAGGHSKHELDFALDNPGACGPEVEAIVNAVKQQSAQIGKGGLLRQKQRALTANLLADAGIPRLTTSSPAPSAAAVVAPVPLRKRLRSTAPAAVSRSSAPTSKPVVTQPLKRTSHAARSLGLIASRNASPVNEVIRKRNEAKMKAAPGPNPRNAHARASLKALGMESPRAK